MAIKNIKVKVNVENNFVVDKTEEKKLCKILVSKGDKGQDGNVSFDELTEEQKAQLKGEDGKGIPEGGTAGQILAKTSDNDFDAEWIDNNAEVDLTEYAKKEEIPTKVSELENDSNYLSSIPDEYITEEELEEKCYLTEHQDLSEYAKKEYVDEKIANIDIGGGIDLSEYAKKEEIPTKTSQLKNDSNYLSSIPDEYITENELNEKGFLTEHQDLSEYAKKEYVDEKITSIPSVEKFEFPVGYIYMSVEETSPAELFGGIWEQIKDTFLLACGDTYNNGDVGGEAEHTLIIDEIPAHSHNFIRSRLFFSEEAGQNAIGYGNNSGTAITATTQNSGGNKAHNNMPPYLAIYMWKKVA